MLYVLKKDIKLSQFTFKENQFWQSEIWAYEKRNIEISNWLLTLKIKYIIKILATMHEINSNIKCTRMLKNDR